MNLRHGGFVEPTFDERPDCGETPGSIDDVEFTHLFIESVSNLFG